MNKVKGEQEGFNHHTKSEQGKTNQKNICDMNGFPNTTTGKRKREGVKREEPHK